MNMQARRGHRNAGSARGRLRRDCPEPDYENYGDLPCVAGRRVQRVRRTLNRGNVATWKRGLEQVGAVRGNQQRKKASISWDDGSQTEAAQQENATGAVGWD